MKCLRRSGAPVRDQHESPMVVAGRRARPVRMKGGRRCPPASRRFLPTMLRAFLGVAGYLLSLLQTRRRIILPGAFVSGVAGVSGGLLRGLSTGNADAMPPAVYRCESEAGQMVCLCASHLQQRQSQDRSASV